MTEPLVLVSHTGYICHIQLNRPEKVNAANRQMLSELAQAFTDAQSSDEVRVIVVSSTAKHFTAGLDIPDILETAQDQGMNLIPEGLMDPWAITTPRVSKPVIIAVSGNCFTLGVELILASDIAISDTTGIFGQIEASRGILPFGGATLRFPARCGWGDAMKYMLTGESFDAKEALRIRLIQEVVPEGTHVERALELAKQICTQAPLAVQAIIRNASLAITNQNEAITALPNELSTLLKTEDFSAGVRAFSTRSLPEFKGK